MEFTIVDEHVFKNTELKSGVASRIAGLFSRIQLTRIAISVLAIFSVTLFAAWWFNPEHIPGNFNGIFHIFDVLLYLFVSYIIWHPIVMEVLTWSISSHIKDIPEQLPAPGHRVAFITTIVPKSEPVDLLHACLPAMMKADYPHDTWILDEGNSPEVKAVCELYGVNHFSRHGVSEYNMPDGKFAAKTKGGNHNSWYDAYGDSYDFVAQIDTDFVPERTFLTKTLGYFKDPQIAFVGTPQIYGNINDSFIARGAAEQQYSFYGTVLRGLSGMDTTLLIGANHVVRVEALKSVDHYSAHITEDLLTGMKLHESGWKSVYVPQALAVGEGPTTWEAYLNQQMRWAYGCMDILFKHSPKFFKKLGLRRSIYYFFLQQHYFSGIAMALSLVLLTVYFIFGVQSADINVIAFFTAYSFVMVVCWLMSVWLQHYHVRNKDETGLLLAGKIISIAAWPIWFLAFISVLRGKRLTYKVTPKGEHESKHSAFSPVFIPHLVFGCIGIAGIVISFFTQHQSIVMYFWAVISIALMFSVPFTEEIVGFIKHVRQWFYTRAQKIHHINGLALSDQSAHNVAPRTNETLFDLLFLAGVTTTSFILYIKNLGFYSDDWSFLGNFQLSKDQSLFGLIQTATTPNTMMRPMQNFYDALLYWSFGTQPLGYHIVNSCVLIAIALLLYLVLKKLTVPRVLSLTIALVYILLPHYATNRFWYASFQANLSMLFYLLSLYAGLTALAHESVRSTQLKILSIVAMLLSALSYEVILPLFLLNLVLIWNPVNLFRKTVVINKLVQRRPSVFMVVIIVALGYVLQFKYLTTTRLGNSSGGSLFDLPQHIFYVISEAFKTNYITYVVEIPRIMWVISERYLNLDIFILGSFLGIGIFWYLYYIISRPDTDFPGRYWMRNLILIGLVVFVLGYAIFFVNDNVAFSPTGIANRVAFVGALGVALSIVGAFGWIYQLVFHRSVAKFLFPATIAVTCMSGFIIINTVSLFWTDAYKQQHVVLADIVANVPVIEPETTIFLDGVCPYVGPATVFETDWDIKGALQLQYNSPSLKANVVSPRLLVTDDGITTSIYGNNQDYPFYPYGKIYIYNYNTKQLYSVANADAADYYFENINPNYKTSCPAGVEGSGVEIF